MANCRLTERIEIEKLDLSTNENGFEEEIWQSHYKCWSAFKTITGKEYVAAKANNSENIVTFSVRHCKKIKELLDPGATKVFRIKYKGFCYDILYVSDFENRHEFVDIKAKINC